MLFIKVGKRIEAGMVFDGRLYHGAQGAAGLIGQLPIGPEGQTASLESLAGSERIAKDGFRAAETRDSDMLASILARSGRITAVDVGQSAQMGDAVSTEIISRSGRIIGQVVATLANMLNPSLIVLSGSVAQTNDILLASVREAVYRSSHPLVTRDLRIVSSQMGNSASLVGAAAVAIERLFEAETLRSWVLYGSPLVSPAFQSALEMARKVSREDAGKSADMDAPAPPVSMKVKDA
ncbi:MAG TPA: ROK family protein, partial [Paracoccaceae bacterium]|nr:ROK family protein [Paracoccaceae bacterium]